MHIAVYLAAVPTKTKNEFKRSMLQAFAAGASKCGDHVQVVDSMAVIDCDIAVVQGWIGMKSGPHLDLRRRVIENQIQTSGHTLVIDSNLFGFLDRADFNKYLRYSLDGIFPTTGYYFNRDPDPARWQEIKQRYSFRERPWRQRGEHILICLQRDGGWSMDGLKVTDWIADIIPRITRVSDRPILIRSHPGSQRTIPEIRNRWPHIQISDAEDIKYDLDRSWCTVTYNSSPGVASLLWGVPTFVTDPDPGRSQAWPECDHDLDRIEDPKMLDRASLYQRLAQCHFATADLAGGAPWRFMRTRLPNA